MERHDALRMLEALPPEKDAPTHMSEFLMLFDEVTVIVKISRN